MKKIFIVFSICLVTLVATFIIFENLSWYHFGHEPTPVVLGRLILFYSMSTSAVVVIALNIFKELEKV